MFRQRSRTLELLDGTNIPEPDLFQNLKELHAINTYLGGYRITFNGLSKLLKDPAINYSIVDIGSGGGDTLKEIYHWCRSKNIRSTLTGIDLKQSCVNYSTQNNPIPEINFICDDYLNALNHLEKIDLIHASLFCHHLDEKQIITLINFAQRVKATLLVNDLERNPIAYYAIKLLTSLFSKSYLVKNDAPLSVLRGFKRREWEAILKQSSAVHYEIRNKWAFRHQVIIYAS